MSDAVVAARSFVTEASARLPLAGTKSAAWRGAGWHRPQPGSLPPRTDTLDLLDRDACRLARREAQCRLVQAQVVAALLQRRLWRSLGFARLPDYAAARLGLHARSLEEDARVAAALESLPKLRAAFDAGGVRWTHLRLLAGVATPSSEDEWLRLALMTTTRRLADLVKAVRNGSAASPSAQDGGSDGEDASPDACASPRSAASADAAGDETADPPVVWSIVTTRTGRKLWRMVGDLASR